MWRKTIESFFFSNYFLGVLAISLSVETCYQLGLPLNSFAWYLLLFSAVTIYYTYAYLHASTPAKYSNPRTEWYILHHNIVLKSQMALGLLATFSVIALTAANFSRIALVPTIGWFFIGLALLAAGSYYGKLSFLNLRQSTLAKPLTIGFCWGVAVSIVPVMVLYLERGIQQVPLLLTGWLFFKNWMFCSVNAILFDVKDYADDSNQQLKTFVVKFGIRATVTFIILPMITLGALSFLLFALYRDFSIYQILINLIPFVLTYYLAISMTQRKRSILYYLILIDGMLFVKAVCGILATKWI